MKIETKYNIGDKVWVIDDVQKAVNVEIQHMDVEFHSATPFDDDMLSILMSLDLAKDVRSSFSPPKKNYLNRYEYK